MLMISPADLERITALSNKGKESARAFLQKREIYAQVKDHLGERIFVGLAGLRGVGKTILLRQLADELPDSVYLSADLLENIADLFELAQQLEEDYQTKYLLVDEIHGFPNWQKELKKIFDFLRIQVIFTSSSALSILESRADLSRRVVVLSMPAFSFREFLRFSKKKEIAPLELESILRNPKEAYRRLHEYEPYFAPFCTGNILPSYLNAPRSQTVLNILEKIVRQDLPAISKLGQDDTVHIMRMLRFIGVSGVDGINYSSISSNCAIPKHKVIEYAALLQKAFVLQIILPAGSNVLKEPKILLALPFRSHLASGAPSDMLAGAQREEFFVHHMSAFHLNYLKGRRGEKLADYLLIHKGKKFVFEIGGAGKTAEQFKGIDAEGKFILSQPGNIKKRDSVNPVRLSCLNYVRACQHIAADYYALALIVVFAPFIHLPGRIG